MNNSTIQSIIQKAVADVLTAISTELTGGTVDEAPRAKRKYTRRAEGTALVKKARKVRAWPKCPVCGKNASPRGKGFCGEHMKKTRANAKKAKPAAAKRAAVAAKPKKVKASKPRRRRAKAAKPNGAAAAAATT